MSWTSKRGSVCICRTRGDTQARTEGGLGATTTTLLYPRPLTGSGGSSAPRETQAGLADRTVRGALPPTSMHRPAARSRRSASVPAGSVRTGAGGAHLFAHTRRDGPVEHTHDPARATCCQMKATSARRKQQDQQSRVKGAPFLHSFCGHKLQIFTTRRSKLLLLLNLLAF